VLRLTVNGSTVIAKAHEQISSTKINSCLLTGTIHKPIVMNVLLVDDDKIFNLLSRKTLGNMDFIEEIHTALNGKEAIDLINDYFQGSKTLPDIILLDLNMPIMDGFGFIEALKNWMSVAIHK
jgi:CheY-like chemotaxis protein